MGQLIRGLLIGLVGLGESFEVVPTGAAEAIAGVLTVFSRPKRPRRKTRTGKPRPQLTSYHTPAPRRRSPTR